MGARFGAILPRSVRHQFKPLPQRQTPPFQALALDSTLARIDEMGGRDVSSLNSAERYRFYLWPRQRWITFQNVYFQNELGVFDPRVWVGYHNIICGVANTPGEIAEWPRHRAVLDTGFVAVVEAC